MYFSSGVSLQLWCTVFTAIIFCNVSLQQTPRTSGSTPLSTDRPSTHDMSVCSPNQFECERLKICIPASFTCDGHEDCTDGSDEKDCPDSDSESADKDDDDDDDLHDSFDGDGKLDFSIPKIVGTSIGVLCAIVLLVMYIVFRVRRSRMNRQLRKSEQDMLNETCAANLARRAAKANAENQSHSLEMSHGVNTSPATYPLISGPPTTQSEGQPTEVPESQPPTYYEATHP